MRMKQTLNQMRGRLKMDSEYFAPINTVSRELGVPTHTLRYWEKQFPTVVRPVAGAGGRRYYRPETIARLKTIQDLLYNRGMTIAGVKKLIRGGEFIATNFAPGADNAPSRGSSATALDTTKIDLAIGLLNQARELLK